MIIFALGSLTIISSRQAALSGAESDLILLQERMTGAIFLSLDSVSSGDVSTGNINSIPSELISKSYFELVKKIDQTKFEIAGGESLLNDLKPNNYSAFLSMLSLEYLSSDMLLGILLITSGILGSIMSTMRHGYERVSKTIVLGGSVGFVALLGVKGGSTLFIMTSTGIDVAFNPYSTAFAGVVAGMFSEKLYFALSRLTDKAFGDTNR